MDFTKALTYPFEDQDWLKKLLFAVVAGIIPIIGNPIALQGWSYEIARRVKNNEPTPLAEWDDLGGLLTRGLMIVLALLVYQIPFVIFACIAAFSPTLLAAGGGNDNATSALAGVVGIVALCCWCIAILYALAAAVVFWGGYVRYLDKPEFGTFMAFGDNLALVRNNMGDFGMALLFVLIGGAIAGILTGTFIGALVAGAFTSYYSSHILGQLAQKISGSAAPQV